MNIEQIQNEFNNTFKEEKQLLENTINDKDNIIKNLKIKYESLIEKNKNLEINNEKNINEINQLNNINDNNLSKIKQYENELLHLNEILMNIFHIYHLYFLPKSKSNISLITFQNKMEEFNQIIIDSEKKINHYFFQNLHKLLESKNKLSLNYKTLINKTSKPSLSKSKSQKKLVEGISKPLFLKKTDDNNKKDNLMNNKFSNKNINNNEFILSKEELENMSNSKIIQHCLKVNDIIQELNKTIQKYNDINLENEENKKQINYLKFNLNNIKNDLEEQVKINNNNKIIITSQNRTIEKFNKNIFNDLYKNDENECLSLNLSPKKKKKIIHFNKSQINLKTNNDIIYNNVYNKELSPTTKKYNLFSKNKNKELKELHLPINYENNVFDNNTTNSKSLFNKNLYTKFSSQKTTNSKSYKKEYNLSYN